MLGWTPDFEWVFSEATKLGDPIESTFLARPSSGGSLETIVDHTGEFSASLAGTSEDASEVLFESRKASAPRSGARQIQPLPLAAPNQKRSSWSAS